MTIKDTSAMIATTCRVMGCCAILGNFVDCIAAFFDERKEINGNIKAYLLTALYNAPATINSYYQAEVNHDMYGG